MLGHTQGQAEPVAGEPSRTPIVNLAADPRFARGAVVVAAPVGSDLPASTPAFHFRGYRLEPRARVLLRNGKPLPMGSRAFDVLCVLLAARGQLVERTELMRRVWPNMVVEESNLRFQIACVRRALGEDRDLIKSVAGRGYIFVAEREHAAPGWCYNPVGVTSDRLMQETPSASLAAKSSQTTDPTGAQSPEDYRASCELLRELLNQVLHELRELRGCGPA